ncbi:MAG: nicotinate-nucleotide adenylyltransferase [Acidobacteriota bacterium]|nr:nicotinate-nucleotide adenylyltransferase [Acidobacteriota bacterium]MDW3228266.1 nicotinate-nucleotide adenylyltransferase [Acidobacteriota bacterium]MDY0230991.1 nicotinate-nucleotide adenylyltransferase [Candidatus Saccharicenans sp.]
MIFNGLFGGTFNPIHNGHLKAALEVIARLPLDRVLFIPSYIPPHKNHKEVVPVRHRLKMVEIACQGYLKFLVSDVEARRPGPSYSISTLKKFKTTFQDEKFFFIVGSDAFLEIDTWKDYSLLLKECSFIVVTRPGFGLELVKKVIDKIRPANLFIIDHKKTISKEELLIGGIYLLEAATPDISSTEIRRRLQAGLPISGLVPKGVEDYIKKYKLYH